MLLMNKINKCLIPFLFEIFFIVIIIIFDIYKNNDIYKYRHIMYNLYKNIFISKLFNEYNLYII